MSFIDMEKLRPDIYLTDEQKEAMRSALQPPTYAERIKTWELPSIICFLRCHASHFRMDSSPHCKNIQPIDCDQLAEVFDALANRLTEIITPDESVPSDSDAAKKGVEEGQSVSSGSKDPHRMETMRFVVKYNFPVTPTGLLMTPLLSSLASCLIHSMEVDATCAMDAVKAVLAVHPGVLIKEVSVLKTDYEKGDEQ